MNRKEVVSAIAQRTGAPQTDVDRTITALEEVLVDAVARGEKVQLPGFLSVERVKRSARTGRNPQTGATIEIPEGFSVKATPGSRLKGAV